MDSTNNQRSWIRRIADAGDKALDANEKSKSSRWAKKIDKIANRFLAFWGALIASFIGFLTIGNFRAIVDDVNAYIEPEGDSPKGMAFVIMAGLLGMMISSLGLLYLVGIFAAWVSKKAERQSHRILRIALDYVGIAPMIFFVHLIYTGGMTKTDAGHKELIGVLLVCPLLFEIGRTFNKWRKNRRKPVASPEAPSLFLPE
jgi:hypothetical protein